MAGVGESVDGEMETTILEQQQKNIKKKKKRREPHTGRRPCEDRGKDGMIHLQAKDHQGLPALTRS